MRRHHRGHAPELTSNGAATLQVAARNRDSRLGEPAEKRWGHALMPHRVEKWGGHGKVPPANEEVYGLRQVAAGAASAGHELGGLRTGRRRASTRLQTRADGMASDGAARTAAAAAAPEAAAPAAAAAAASSSAAQSCEKRGGSQGGDPHTTYTARTPEGEAAARRARPMPHQAETTRTAGGRRVPRRILPSQHPRLTATGGVWRRGGTHSTRA